MAPLTYFCIAFVQVLDNQLIQVLLPVLRESNGNAADQLLTAYAAGAAVIPFLIARRADPTRISRTITIALGVLAASALLFAAGPGLTVRAALRFLSGAASGTLSFALPVSAQLSTHTARAMTHQSSGFVAALVIGVPLGPWLYHHTGLSGIYYGVAAVALALSALTARSFGLATAPFASTGAATPLRHNRCALLALAATALTGAAMAGPAGFLSSFLKEVRGLDLQVIGLVYLAAGIAPLIATPLASALLQRRRPDLVAAAGSVIFALPLLAFPSFATGVVTAAAGMAVVLFLETIRRAGLQLHLAGIVDRSNLARFLAIRGVVAQAGLAIGFAASSPLYGTAGYQSVCNAAAVASVTAAVLLWIGARQGRAPESLTART